MGERGAYRGRRGHSSNSEYTQKPEQIEGSTLLAKQTIRCGRPCRKGKKRIAKKKKAPMTEGDQNIGP